MNTTESLSGESPTILIVDDNSLDVERIQRSLGRWGITNPIERAVDGIAALERLRGDNGVDKLEQPFVILLDLNMPRMDGVEFLGELQADPELSAATVIVISTSERDVDLDSAQELGAAGYIVKPFTNDKLLKVLASAGFRCSLHLPPEPVKLRDVNAG